MCSSDCDFNAISFDKMDIYKGLLRIKALKLQLWTGLKFVTHKLISPYILGSKAIILQGLGILWTR